jgi:hypothetical protein
MGDSDPTGGFCFGTLSFVGPSVMVGVHLGCGYRILCCHSWRDGRGVEEACKLGLRSPLLCLMRAQPLYILGYDTAGLQKLVVTLTEPRILSHNLPFSPFLLPYI